MCRRPSSFPTIVYAVVQCVLVPLNARRETERPEGRSISFSQANKDCDLAVKWHRQRVPRKDLSIALIYGSALHRGIELFMRKTALTPDDAVRGAIGHLDTEIRHPGRKKLPLRWDDEPELNQDGGISKARGNYGKLWCREVAVFWLRHQIPIWLEKYAASVEFTRTEHRLFTSMRKEEHWQWDWTFESILDLECQGDLILDLKSTSEPWEDSHKYLMQAHLYMGAYYQNYDKRIPSFKFLVMPRVWDSELGGPSRTIQEFPVIFDMAETKKYIEGVIRPKVNMIESNNFPANPTSWSCNAKWCAYHHHCRFGTGDHL